jgi:CRISPR-associated protein Cas6
MLIDTIFPVTGRKLNADHNYYLFSALCYLIPRFHTLDGFSFNTINGIPDKQGSILLGDKSILRIRLPVEHYQLTNSLIDRIFGVNTYQIKLGRPSYEAITPKERLTSRIVTIKGAETSEDFVRSCQRQLQAMEINAIVMIVGRCTLRITKGRPFHIAGFTTVFKNLTPEDSVKVQELGIGGKRRLGCGVFV